MIKNASLSDFIEKFNIIIAYYAQKEKEENIDLGLMKYNPPEITEELKEKIEIQKAKILSSKKEEKTALEALKLYKDSKSVVEERDIIQKALKKLSKEKNRLLRDKQNYTNYKETLLCIMKDLKKHKNSYLKINKPKNKKSYYTKDKDSLTNVLFSCTNFHNQNTSEKIKYLKKEIELAEKMHLELEQLYKKAEQETEQLENELEIKEHKVKELYPRIIEFYQNNVKDWSNSRL